MCDVSDPVLIPPKYPLPQGPPITRAGLMTKLMNRSLKAKLPRLFSKGKHIEKSNTVKIKKRKVRYW